MNTPAPRLVEVILTQPHTHAGQASPAGAKLKVDEPTRDWLVAQGVVNATPPPKDK